MEGWVDLGYPALHRPGFELTIFRSLVWRDALTTTLPSHPVIWYRWLGCWDKSWDARLCIRELQCVSCYVLDVASAATAAAAAATSHQPVVVGWSLIAVGVLSSHHAENLMNLPAPNLLGYAFFNVVWQLSRAEVFVTVTRGLRSALCRPFIKAYFIIINKNHHC